MTLLRDEQGLVWESGVATVKGTNIRFRLTDQHCLDIQSPCPFAPGMKLEAIDPRHQSTFCVATVTEIRGTRMHLHLDGYPDIYDFWVNHNSWGIFPCGFCETSGRTLSVPPDEGQAFSWTSYLRRTGSVAAPRSLFRSNYDSGLSSIVMSISVGDRLEAKQRRPPFRWGAASVVDHIGDRILVRFDGSHDDTFDEWYSLDSPYIGAVGHCDSLDVSLSVIPPTFTTWSQYLREQKAKSIPQLKARQPHDIQLGTMFETVDPYNRKLIRRAQVVKVKPYSIQLRFEGWLQSYHDFWVDPDSEDLHPLGWCLENCHPLEPSPSSATPGCSVGCRGVGNVKGPTHRRHSSPQDCPYAKHNVERVLPRRFEPNIRWSSRCHRSSTYEDRLNSQSALRKAVHNSIFQCLPDNCSSAVQNNSMLRIEHLDIENWDCARVASEVAKVTGSNALGDVFVRNGIDGVALLCLRREDLTEVLGIKMGPALKIGGLISLQQQQ